MQESDVLNPGIRVKAVGNFEGKRLNGYGKVVFVRLGSPSGNVLVEFDRDIGGHDGNSIARGKNGHCWWLPKRMCTRVEGAHAS